jgi:flagellar motor component MotA
MDGGAFSVCLIIAAAATRWEIIMFAVIGIVVVFGAVVGGYLMEHGNLKVLLRPAELLIIGGAGAGTVLIANPLHILKQIAGGIGAVFKGSKFTKRRYIESLKLAYELLNKARRQGLMSLESDVEAPDQSPIFSKDPEFLKNRHVRYFFCDSMRMAISGMEAFELDQLMDLDLEVLHHEATQPVASLSAMAVSLPGLGIVAAVWAWSSRWEHWEDLPKTSVTRLPRLLWVLFSEFCFATAWLAQLQQTWPKLPMRSAPISTS